MSRLSQETLAIIGASVGLAVLILNSTAGIRGEIRDVRSEIQNVHAEARADRETFQNRIIRLIEQQGIHSTRASLLLTRALTAPFGSPAAGGPQL